MNRIIAKIGKGIVFSLSIGLVVSCSLQKNPEPGIAKDSINKELEEAVFGNQSIENELPDAVAQALIPDETMIDFEAEEIEDAPRFDIAVRDMDASQFFMNLVEDTPYSITVHPSVEGNISLSLKEVTIPEVMDTVRSVYGYDFRATPVGYEILPYGLQTKTYVIDYLNITRSGSSSMSVAGGSGGGGDSGGDSEGGDGGGSASSGGGSSGSAVSTSSSSDFWFELDDSIQAILGEEEGRNVVINPQAGLIVVTAVSREHKVISNYLETLREIIKRQIILEAKVLEVSLKDGYQAGINWAALTEPGRGKSINVSQVGGGSSIAGSGLSSDFSGTLIGAANGGVNLDPFNLTQVQNGLMKPFGGVFSLALNLNDINAFIEVLQGQGNVQVLSSPRVATLNNQKAIIKVGADEYFVTNVTNASVVSGGESVQTSPEVELTQFFSGIALDVTPQVSSDGEITLHVHPTVTTVSDDSKEVTLTTTITIPTAKTIVRETDSIVKARSGQVVVIGGLMQHNSDEVVTQVPILGDLPFVGSAFRQTRQNTHKSELVILIKPMIVDDQNWPDEINASRKRFKKLGKGFHFGTKYKTFGTEGEY